MNDYWQYPTVSMGLGPILSIYQARFNRYLVARKIISPEQEPRVFCFMGDGESDEPESLGALSIAAREKLDNLTFIVNCNLQRLDGPVRGNSKIIQELESVFHGAGWNVIKVIWGSDWDSIKHSVGGYKIEEEGCRLFSKINGDYFSILGMPIIEIINFLCIRGVIDG